MKGYIDFLVYALGIKELIAKAPKLDEYTREVFYLRTSPQPLEVLIKQMEEANVERGILYSINAKRSHGCDMPGNDLLYEIIKKRPELFIGIGSIDPLDDDSLKELERLYSNYEFIGIFLSPAYQLFNPCDEKLSRVYEFLEDNKMLLVLHMGLTWNNKLPIKWSNPLIVDEIARKYSKLKIVITHMAWPWIDDLYTVMFRNRNVYAITSGVFTGTPKEHLRTILTEGYRRRITERFIADRLLFGSEFPRMEIWKMVDAILSTNLSENTKIMILRDNAVSLLTSISKVI